MYIYSRKAYYHETDQMGVIHHANFVKWLEEARIEYLASLGVSYKSVEEGGILSPISKLSVDYISPVLFGDELEVRITITKYSGIVLELKYEIVKKETGDICASAASRHGFIKNGNVISLKREVPDVHEIIMAQYKSDAATAEE